MADQATDTASAALLKERLAQVERELAEANERAESMMRHRDAAEAEVFRLRSSLVEAEGDVSEKTHGPFCAEECACGLGNGPMTHQATDTTSAALLKEAQAVLDLDGDPRVTPMEAMLRAGGIIRRLMSALASLPAPASAAMLKALDQFNALQTRMVSTDRGELVMVLRSDVLGILVNLRASLPAPAAPVIVVQVPDGWRVAQWDGQRYVSIGLPYPTERQANSDCALILARVQPAPAAPEEEKVGGE